ncbi:GNAT family N-acetyltransferase [candidate division KSB1 bacterium]|nr:GNAT family N-acetyltransferase [candidate division KSB1 bacterium]
MNKFSRKLARFVKYRRYRYCVYTADAISELSQPTSDLAFEFKTFDETALDLAFKSKEPGRYKLFIKFLYAGYIGVYCDSGGKILAYGWGMVHRGDERFFSNNHLPLSDGEGHIFYCYTKEAFRGHNLYSGIIYRLAETIFAEGAHLLWIDTNDDNLPAQKGILKVGFRLYGIMTNVFLFKRLVCSRVKKQENMQ